MAVVFAFALSAMALLVAAPFASADDVSSSVGPTESAAPVATTPTNTAPTGPTTPAKPKPDKISIPVPEPKKKKKPAAPKINGNSGAEKPDTNSTTDAADPFSSAESPSNGPITVPNLFLRQFQIPPFLLPIYQAAGIQYGIRWEVLAAINEIETNYGRNLNVSTAGALGWMQFMPATWDMYGVDANGDGVKDPYNPVDAIFAAANYLKAAGGMKDLQRAIFAYNHAQWYVDQVVLRAKLISGVPDGLIDSITGLTQGHFPVYARSSYAGAVTKRKARGRAKVGTNAARVVEGKRRNGIKIYSRHGAPVVAVQDAVVVKIGANTEDGRFIVIQDSYGNRYRYTNLGSISRLYPVPRRKNDARTATNGKVVSDEPGTGDE
ncbi:MAG TPA: lytic transglycosylase domain-containing protein, partial [Solirubrobacterales bacterium]|nr:lytic transglycosylase domain-containing protein [Solirubrobacterales bacterium]